MATDNRTYRTKVYLTCSNSQKNYNFSFDYINSKYVKATLNNTQVLQWGTDYTVNGHTLTLVNNPPQGALLLIYRNTPADRTVEWYDSSILRARDMNLFNTQMLHINEENQDELLDSGIQEDKLDNRWDARWKNIKNLKEPSQDNHAVNLGYLKNTQESYLNASQAKVNEATAQANNSKKSADDAKRYAEQAKGSAEQASVSEATATAKATEASVSATTAITKATEASTSATTATTKAREASISANTAGSHKDITKEYMDKTLAYKLEAEASAQLAEDHKNASIDSAELAKQYRDETIERSGGNYVTVSSFEEHLEDDTAHQHLFKGLTDTLNDYKGITDETLSNMVSEFEKALDTKADIVSLNTLEDTVGTKMPINGGTFKDTVNIAYSDYSAIQLWNTEDRALRIEVVKDSATAMGKISKRDGNNTIMAELVIPNKSGVLATTRDVETRMPITGGTFTNNISIDTGEFSSIQLINQQGYKLMLENAPNDRDRIGTLLSQDNNGIDVYRINIPKKSGTLATEDYVKEIAVNNRYVVTAKGTSGNTWWREYSDGWIEMGGLVDVPKIVGPVNLNEFLDVVITYPKPFKARPYTTVLLRSTDKNLLCPSLNIYENTRMGVATSVIGTRAKNFYAGIVWTSRGWKA